MKFFEITGHSCRDAYLALLFKGVFGEKPRYRDEDFINYVGYQTTKFFGGRASLFGVFDEEVGEHPLSLAVVNYGLDGPESRLRALYTPAKYRNQGGASFLVNSLAQELQLLVAISEKGLKAFYESCGFNKWERSIDKSGDLIGMHKNVKQRNMNKASAYPIFSAPQLVREIKGDLAYYQQAYKNYYDSVKRGEAIYGI
ncbi:hypothetical protein [Billgrantia ethanolica]|uniref:N-acetyltransferase domain-containing protein n=1 Tax=Billgrantia ethanolica TaxID=2733486 RepID=A0ABS9A153_9GAMM|nr:hypothetical protein [Halomonas ethanolica]MCE8002539.1 hypothetical protein [Halomonas ethanolica]